MNLSELRSDLAEVVDDIGAVRRGSTYRPTAPQAGDAWPILRRMEPSTFGTCRATWDVVVVLSDDEPSAAAAFDDIAMDLLDRVGRAGYTPVSVTPQSLILGGAELFACVATVLTEVEII